MGGGTVGDLEDLRVGRDLGEGTFEAVRVAGEADGRGVREVFALAVDRDALSAEVTQRLRIEGVHYVKDTPVALAINKIDRVKAERLLALSQEMNEAFPFERTFMISAERGHGTADLKRWLAERMPEGPWLYPEDQIADLPMRMIAAEMTREKLTLRLHQELPYELTVETEAWEERKDGSAVIHQQILVARDTQRAIVLGKGGTRIKEIGARARAELSRIMGVPVHLYLHVKVNPKWEEDRSLYREIGLDWVD